MLRLFALLVIVVCAAVFFWPQPAPKASRLPLAVVIPVQSEDVPVLMMAESLQKHVKSVMQRIVVLTPKALLPKMQPLCDAHHLECIAEETLSATPTFAAVDYAHRSPTENYVVIQPGTILTRDVTLKHQDESYQFFQNSLHERQCGMAAEEVMIFNRRLMLQMIHEIEAKTGLPMAKALPTLAKSGCPISVAALYMEYVERVLPAASMILVPVERRVKKKEEIHQHRDSLGGHYVVYR